MWVAALLSSAMAAVPPPEVIVAIGGGSVVSGGVAIATSEAGRFRFDVGLRPALGSELSLTLPISVGFASTLPVGARVGLGGFGVLAGCPPLGFSEGWVAAGMALDVLRKGDRSRAFSLEMGPALFLWRDLPEGFSRSTIVFGYLRGAFHFRVG